MKRSTTLRAFLLSCVSVFLCVAMLMGSTFAWFTDSVESAKNVIAAGNLDIELYHSNETDTDEKVESGTALFDAVKLWEPNAIVYEEFTIMNEGSLALKYQFSLEALKATVVGGHSFAEMLQVAVVTDPNYTYSRDSITTDSALVWKNLETFTLDGNLEAGASTVYGIVIWWKPTADDNIFNMRNENNGETVSVEVGIKLVATQYSFENDSFDKTYDEDANQIHTSTAVKLPTDGNATVNDTVLTTVDDVDMEVTLSAEFLTALARSNDAPTSVALSHAEPKFDTVNKTIKFDHIEIVDENGDIIDLEAIGNDKPVTVKFNVGDAFNVGDTVIVYHDGELFATPVVDADENITYTATHFCEVVVGYNDGKIDTAEELYATIAAVEDGDVIKLAANIVFNKTYRQDSGGGWYEGLNCESDKSFTIDLNGFTITNEANSLNDRLLRFANNGSKANTITIKNGNLIGATGVYSVIATGGSNAQKLTINLENVNATLDNSNGSGAAILVRGGAELNVKAGTVITAANAYCAIECAGSATIANIYDGAKIYQNGNSSYCGSLVGVSGNGTVNVHGGYGKGVKGGFIAMTSGGTINVYGGEWIANTDGTPAKDNLSVLIAQSDERASCVINVVGGTFRGSYNCYGNVAGDAQINISGGNFNADPARYLVKGFSAEESEGVWTIAMGDLHVTDAADLEYARPGHTIYIDSDITLTEEVILPANVTLVGSGKQINGTIYAGGNLTIKGHIKVTAFSASYYNRVITIGPGACLEVTGGGRVSLAYGNVFNITGTVKDAKNADKSAIQPSLIIPGGISITGGSDATMNITNAYVVIGGTSSKDNAAGGTFTFNFDNSIVEFTNQFTLSEPTGGKTPTFVMNVKDSVVTTATKFIIAAPNSTVVLDNSVLAAKTYFRNSGEITLKNGSELTASTIQFGENGGNNGTTIVDNSTFTITATSTAHALDGKGTGKIVAQNDATVSVTYYKGITVECDETSTFEGTEVK